MKKLFFLALSDRKFIEKVYSRYYKIYENILEKKCLGQNSCQTKQFKSIYLDELNQST